MGSAQVTLKLSPKQFDLVREALDCYIAQLEEEAKDPATPPATRANVNSQILHLRALINSIER